MSSVLERQRPSFACVGVLAAALFLPAGLLAQSGAGSIQGTIQDATSARDTGLPVHIVNQQRESPTTQPLTAAASIRRPGCSLATTL